MKPEKNIITYGTFDMFHIGHLNLLKSLSALGDKLIVGVSSDEFNKIKGKEVLIPYEQRAEIVSNIKGVSLVIREEAWDQKISDIKKYDIDTFAIGNDWAGKFDNLKEHCEVIYLDRTEGISTSELKHTLRTGSNKLRSDLLKVLADVEIILDQIP